MKMTLKLALGKKKKEPSPVELNICSNDHFIY